VCYQVEISSSVLSFIQRNPTEFGVPKCDREASVMRRALWVVAVWGKNVYLIYCVKLCVINFESVILQRNMKLLLMLE